MVSSYIFYMKKTLVIAKVTIVSGTLNAALLFVLSKEFGLIGAAWAMCAGMILQFSLTWFYASSMVPMPWLLRRKV